MESRLRLIVVDVGNTSTAVGLWVDGKVSLVSHIDGDIREAFAAVSSLAARCKGGVRIAYVSVVPAKDRKFASFFKKAGFDCMKSAAEKVGTRLQEPIAEIKIRSEKETLADCMMSLCNCRGSVSDIGEENGKNH